METHNESIIIYTDGACSGNPGVGGYGAVVLYNDVELTVRGGDIHTTNGRMELQAVIGGLGAAMGLVEMLDGGYLPPIVVHTDSTYCLYALDHAWRKGKLKKGAKTNGDLLEDLDLLISKLYLDHEHLITGVHVKGHSGDPLNERCDALAREGLREIKEIAATPHAIPASRTVK